MLLVSEIQPDQMLSFPREELLKLFQKHFKRISGDAKLMESWVCECNNKTKSLQVLLM